MFTKRHFVECKVLHARKQKIQKTKNDVVVRIYKQQIQKNNTKLGL